jgi:hypothetical protein
MAKLRGWLDGEDEQIGATVKGVPEAEAGPGVEEGAAVPELEQLQSEEQMRQTITIWGVGATKNQRNRSIVFI